MIKYNITKKLLIIFFIFISAICQAQAETSGGKTEEKSLYAALLGGIFANTVFHGASRLFGAEFAQTTPQSIQFNLKSDWVWDSDGFLFNHPGHPYQGSLYHAAARSSGFNFYESVFFDALGSLSWELFGETDIPALNDLIVTTAGGAAFGEMLHLLYLETASPWAALSVSPMSALTNAALKRKPQRTRNLYYLSVMAGAGWLQSNKKIQHQFDSALTGTNSSSMIPVYIGCDIIYNNPFTANSATPYSQFEIMTRFGFSFWPLWLDWTILTDGYLVSFNPVDTEKDTLSTGLSLHYDLITGSNMNFSSQALDWSVKWRHSFQNTILELKAHAGWTFFSSSQYYPDIENSAALDIINADNDYGTGGNIKFTIAVHNPKWGSLSLGMFNYLLYIIPHNKPDSRGFDFFNLSYIEYEYHFNKRFSLAVNNSFYIKNINSYQYTGASEIADRIMIYMNWTFINVRQWHGDEI